VELEHEVWNFDPSDSVSHHIMAVAREAGGQVFGAYDGERMIGFALSFPAFRDGGRYLHSHMAAVIPAYQAQGVGRLLKLAQREDALGRGISLIEWTFDPLQARNANFNINRLGAVVGRYIPNFYGASSSPLHANLPTDRLVAEWHLDSARVRAHIDGKGVRPTASTHRISIPNDINELRRDDPSKAAEIQMRMRREFQEAFQQHFTVTSFVTDETNGHYLLEKNNED
jgi:predicted GNAT superfamily acetyltransferase